jgi:uncharacterized protein YbjT (DUF2867 family)
MPGHSKANSRRLISIDHLVGDGEPQRGDALAAEAAAGSVRHHVALSIVGIDRSDNGYFRAKVAQEKLIETSHIPYTIICSTQFLEFLRGIAAEGTDGNTVGVSPGLFHPIAADDVAAVVADVALAAPHNGIVDRRPGTSAV